MLKSFNIDSHLKRYKDCEPGQIYVFIDKLKELADKRKSELVESLETQLESLKNGKVIPATTARSGRKPKNAVIE